MLKEKIAQIEGPMLMATLGVDSLSKNFSFSIRDRSFFMSMGGGGGGVVGFG